MRTAHVKRIAPLYREKDVRSVLRGQSGEAGR